MGNNNVSENKWSAKKINVIWIISLLIMIIIALSSYIICGKMYSSSVFINHISNGSLLLSIILSIFAIQYTYHSNIQVQSQFDKINNAAINIDKTSLELHDVSKKLDKSIDNISLNIGLMNKKMDDMNMKNNNTQGIKNISNIPNKTNDTDIIPQGN